MGRKLLLRVRWANLGLVLVAGFGLAWGITAEPEAGLPSDEPRPVVGAQETREVVEGPSTPKDQEIETRPTKPVRKAKRRVKEQRPRHARQRQRATTTAVPTPIVTTAPRVSAPVRPRRTAPPAATGGVEFGFEGR
jgi:hypothetical protein